MIPLPTPVTKGNTRHLQVVGRKSDSVSALERGHVTYEVYVPLDPEHAGIDQIDTHGEFMLLEDLRALASDFLVNSREIAIQHIKLGGEMVDTVHVIESFVNDDRFNVPTLYPGAWVVTLDLSGAPELLDLVKAGELKTVSWTCKVWEQEVLVSQDALVDDPYDGVYDATLSAQEPEQASDAESDADADVAEAA